MGGAIMTDKPHHVLTLVIEKEADVPQVRSKVKLLIRALGSSVQQMTGLAVGASETARLLLQQYGGGKVRISLFPRGLERIACGVELLFQGNIHCLQGKACPADTRILLDRPPFPGLQRVFDSVLVQGGVQGSRITVVCRSIQHDVLWKDVEGRLVVIRRELFADTEESYMENLRAKHDEVVRLLREKTEKNRLLDQSNNELLQLSNDLEQLARERTIIEMSLKIADQVRNPATVIGGMARRLLSKGALPERERKRIDLIAAEADKIEILVKQFAAMAAKRRTLFAREDLSALLKDAFRACPSLQKQQIKVKLHLPEQPVEVHANRQVLKIALVHVLRYLTRMAAEGEELSAAVDAGPEPQIIFTLLLQPGTAADVDPASAVDGQGLALVRQILSEHQAGIDTWTEAGSRLVIALHFPRAFHQQRDADQDMS
jgi:signal transduction histidine kinase